MTTLVFLFKSGPMKLFYGVTNLRLMDNYVSFDCIRDDQVLQHVMVYTDALAANWSYESKEEKGGAEKCGSEVN